MGAAPRLLMIADMLVRYCATHVRHFGYPRVLGLRWNGWAISTAGGLCEVCRERERNRWEADPYGEVLVPVPVELGPRMLGWRVIVATIAGAAVAAAATVVLLLVQPPDHIPLGGDPGLLSSGARLAGPLSAQAEPSSETPVLSRQDDEALAAPGVTAPRAAHRQRRAVAAATRGSMGGGVGPAPAFAPGNPVAVPSAPGHRTAVVIGPGRRADRNSQPVGAVTLQAP